MIYTWKSGAHVHIDAQAAGEEMERLRVGHNGRLEAKDVLEAARSDVSPLHPHFEWDDGIAAEKYRVDQAGLLIRSIVVEIAEAKAPTRAFVSVMRDNDRSYTSVQHALSDDDLRHQVIEGAWAELEAWRRRHAELIEFATLFAVIDQARAA